MWLRDTTRHPVQLQRMQVTLLPVAPTTTATQLICSYSDLDVYPKRSGSQEPALSVGRNPVGNGLQIQLTDDLDFRIGYQLNDSSSFKPGEVSADSFYSQA